ncbi:MAG: hypothetical protein IJT00_10735, partial [Lachnospiraceae bacterium]|nr:hypothetical protein [Lachnospiraceae bacterium]
MKEILCTLVPAALAAMLFTGCGGTAPREEVESTSGMETEASSALPESTAAPAEDYMAAAGSFKVSDVYAPDTQEMKTVIEGCDTFTQIVDRLEDGRGYSNAKIGDQDVLLVADGTYEWEPGVNAAIDAEIFCYSGDAIKYLGRVQAGGTAYPLAVRDGILMVGGNHFMNRLTIKGEELVVAEEAYVKYDSDGSAAYFCRTDGTDFTDHTSEEAEKLLNSYFDELDDGDIIIFDRIRRGEASSSSDSALPHFAYPDDDPVPNAICDYLTTVIAAQYETAEVSIPQISIIEVDESKDDDIKVWGDFWIYNYNLEGETLMTLSGGNYPGLMHLKKNPDGSCSVTSFDQVEDGSNFDSSAKKIFGDKYDRLQEIMSDDKSRDGFRTAMIKNYVEDNGLGITQYQDYG